MNKHDALWVPLDNAIEAFESAIASASHDLAGAIEHENARNARRDLRACIEEALASVLSAQPEAAAPDNACEACEGSGVNPADFSPCSACNGDGKSRLTSNLAIAADLLASRMEYELNRGLRAPLADIDSAADAVRAVRSALAGEGGAK